MAEEPLSVQTEVSPNGTRRVEGRAPDGTRMEGSIDSSNNFNTTTHIPTPPDASADAAADNVATEAQRRTAPRAPRRNTSRLVDASARQIPVIPNGVQSGIETREVDVDTRPLDDKFQNGDVLIEQDMHDVTICERTKHGAGNFDARLPHIKDDASYADVFKHLLPMKWVKNTMIPATNVELRKAGKREMNVDEYFVWLALRLIMAKYYSKKVEEFWQVSRDPLDPLPYFGKFMNKTRYIDIQRNLRLRSAPVTPEERNDAGYYMRELVTAWNENMHRHFFCSEKVCIDETMMGWDNPLGYAQIHCPRKPKQYGNEWKTIACCATNIIFKVDLCETKVYPDYRPPQKYTENNTLSTVSIVMRLTEGISGTGRKVIMDSGFSVLKVLYVLLTFGLYGMFIAKKRGSWPKGIPGEKLKTLMADKPLFSVGTLQGAFNYEKQAKAGHNDFYLMAFKDAQYTGLCAATYGTVHREGERMYRYTNQNGYQIQYPVVYSDYYNKGRAAVDINNNLRSNTISMEEGHFTRSWEMRVHDFFMDLSLTNSVCASRFIYNNPKTVPDYQLLLAKELLDLHVTNDRMTTRSGVPEDQECKLSARPAGKGAWDVKKRAFREVKSKSQGLACSGDICKKLKFKKRPRRSTYCLCTPTDTLCTECYVQHRFNKI